MLNGKKIVVVIGRGLLMGEISCLTKYFKEASFINLNHFIKYGLQVIKVSVLYRNHRMGIYSYPIKNDYTLRPIAVIKDLFREFGGTEAV